MKHWIITFIFLKTISSHLFSFGYTTNHRGPNRHKPHLEKSFIGTIYETSNEVLVQPVLSATDEDMPELQGLICDYQLYSMNKQETEIPFYVSVLDKATGRGKVFLKPDQTLAACDNESAYHLLISAVDCGIGIDEDGKPVGQRSSHRSHLDVTVVAENKHDPYFLTTNYFVDIEGDVTAGQPLLSFDARDNDCFHLYRDICRYEIMGDHGDLFEVTSKGLLLSKKKILAEKTTVVWNMSVKAYDCGERSSLPASINVKVNPICHPHWSGCPESVDFVALKTSSVQLCAKPTLNTCIPRDDVTSIQVTVSLDMSGVESITGCDRDMYAAKDARRMCEGSFQELVELLPSYPAYKRLTKVFDKNTHNLPQYKREVAMQGGRVYAFNGIDQAIEVDDPDARSKLDSREFSSKFSVMFRLFINANGTSKEKSTILCKSDSTGLSRHHFSIYVQHCHLMLLIRRERESKGKLNPAEWHWRLGSGKNCSEKWYQVLITADFPNITLFIDGVKQHPFLIADDYPLHPTSDPTTWTIGAAWQGRRSKYAQYFNGKLSDVIVHVGTLEDVRVMRCVGRCMEGLATVAERSDDPTSLSTFTLHLRSNGSDVDSVTSELERVAYLNKRRFPSGGQRRVKVQTEVTCTPTAKICPFVPPFQMVVDVLPPPDPLITINGDNIISRSPDSVKGHDLHLFDNIVITSGSNVTSGFNVTSEPSLPSHNLDSCVINKMRGEGGGVLEVRPKHLLSGNLLEMEKRDNGITIRGIQPVATYQAVLRGVVYKDDGQNFDEDVFYLFCSELNGRYHSNVHMVSVVEQGGVKLLPVAIPDETPPRSMNSHILPAPLVARDRDGELRLHEVDQEDPFEEQFLLPPDQSYSKTSANAAALVIGVCVCGMVVVVLIITAHTKLSGCSELSGCPEQEDDEEEVVKEHVCYDVEEGDLDWDDSAMTITVNPMERESGGGEDASDYDFSELDEDEICDRDDRDDDRDDRGDDSDDRAPGARQKAVDDSYEWDN